MDGWFGFIRLEGIWVWELVGYVSLILKVKYVLFGG